MISVLFRRAWLWGVGVAALPVCILMLAGPVRGDDRVLLLSSYAAGDHLLEPIADGIREQLSARSGLRLSVEHLDVAHHVEAEHLAWLSQYLAKKYATIKLDAIVALGEPALQFALRSRDKLTPGVPIIFGHVPAISRADVEVMPGVTGVLGGYELLDTLGLMRALHPERRNVLIVDDNSKRGVWLRRSLQLAKELYADRMTFRETGRLSIEALDQELAGLGSQDLVFYLSFTEDSEGNRYDYLDSLGRVSRGSNAPVYGALERMAGYGVVGGYMYSSSDLGLLIGHQLLRLLDGADLSAIPPIAQIPHRFIFDFRQLQRFGISSSSLPSESTVIDEPDTFYYNYKGYFFSALLVFLALIVYIGILLSGIAKRERARRGLERLIGQGEVPLPIEKPSAILDELRDRLVTVVPSLADVSFFKVPEFARPHHALELRPLGPGTGTMPRAQLLDSARERQRNQFGRSEALLVLKTESIPADLAYCRAKTAIDSVDQRIIDLLTRNISIECENLKAARLTSSLETAHQIQSAMLPKNFAEISAAFDVELHAVIRPARIVGGDLYDFFAIDENRLCILIGDVSDKGVPAALFMSMTRTLIRAVAEGEPNPETIIEKVNAKLSADNPHLMFVTLFLAVFDKRTGQLDYVNCGHNAPLLRDARGQVDWISIESNIALGITDTAAFSAQSLTLSAGSTLLLYTDGVTEAENSESSQFGDEKLKALFADRAVVHTRNLLEDVMASVDAFADSAPQTDDITLVALAVRGSPPADRAVDDREGQQADAVPT